MFFMKAAHFRGKRGFSLIEVLTIIFILSILASIMIPNIKRSIWRAKLAGCQSNLRNLAAGVQMYANQEGGGKYPENIAPLVPQYLGRIPLCPSFKIDTYSESYTADNETKNFTVYCKGFNHTEMEMAENEPWYSISGGLGPHGK
jgi:prepilin-type N-terminal cleavage/methylation domain-containing protein